MTNQSSSTPPAPERTLVHPPHHESTAQEPPSSPDDPFVDAEDIPSEGSVHTRLKAISRGNSRGNSRAVSSSSASSATGDFSSVLPATGAGEDHRAGDHAAGDHAAGDHRVGDHASGDHRAGDHRAGDHRAGDHHDVGEDRARTSLHDVWAGSTSTRPNQSSTMGWREPARLSPPHGEREPGREDGSVVFVPGTRTGGADGTQDEDYFSGRGAVGSENGDFYPTTGTEGGASPGVSPENGSTFPTSENGNGSTSYLRSTTSPSQLTTPSNAGRVSSKGLVS